MADEVQELADASMVLDRRTFLMAHGVGVPNFQSLAASDTSFANH
jgi:hypothetical protein